MSEFTFFGEPGEFQIGIRWTSDSEARTRRPLHHGWSVGDLKIVVAGQNLTKSERGRAEQGHIGWYLSPLFDWLASNWVKLLQEEDFSWSEKSSAPAAIACRRAIARWIASDDELGRASYKAAKGWFERHAIRACSEGGLFPDLFVRRLGDTIEISWSSAPPFLPPADFTFAYEPGVVRLPVSQVAVPLWDALQWFSANPPPTLEEEDQGRWTAICEKIDRLRDVTSEELEEAYVPHHVLELARQALAKAGHLELIEPEKDHRSFLETLSPAIAMFGGVSPELNEADVERLCSIMISSQNGGDSKELAALVSPGLNAVMGSPHEDGYALAEELLDELRYFAGGCTWVDVRNIVSGMEITVEDVAFETDSIRGVALAGENFSPVIVINSTSLFNRDEDGRRFTIAHEFCHILFDRTRAKRVSHVSGPWVAPEIEKRANAFAAYLLMPRRLLTQHLTNVNRVDRHVVGRVSKELKVNESALVEHLYNLNFVDDWDRERLRIEYRPQ